MALLRRLSGACSQDILPLDACIGQPVLRRPQCSCHKLHGVSQSPHHPRGASSTAPNSRRAAPALPRLTCLAQPEAYTSAVGVTVRAGDADFQWGSYVSSQPRLAAAVQEAVAAIQRSLGNEGQPTLALVFASASYGPDVDQLVQLLREAVPSLRHVFGCSAFGVLGSTSSGPREVEGKPSLSLTLAQLPGVDISVVHTLRSNIPSEDASPERWAELVGVPLDDPRPLSFIVLSDPRFQQIKPLLAGLDFAFPGAPKIGGMLSIGQRHRRRTMFAWSADGQGGNRNRAPQGDWQSRGGDDDAQRRLRRLQERRRQQQQARMQQERQKRREAEEEQQLARKLQLQLELEQQQQARRQRRRGGLLGVFDKLRDGLADFADIAAAAWEEAEREVEEEERRKRLQEQQQERQQQQEQQEKQQQEEQQQEEQQQENVSASSSGAHMYGTAILALQGNVVLEPITSQGYRTVGDKVWTIERVAKEGVAILSISDPADSNGNGSSAMSSSSMATVMDSSDDEQTPLAALFYLLEQLGKDQVMNDAELEELSMKLAVAVAPDALAADDNIAPDDFQVMEVKYIDDNVGAILVDGEVRTGYRMKLVLRDREGIEQDLRSKLLDTKRRDLMQAMLGGGGSQQQGAAIGALMFGDIERGEELYGQSGFESGLVSQYLPVPVSGMFGSAEISSVNRKTSIYELTCAIGVLRVAPQQDSSQDTDSVQSTAEQEQQPQQQPEER